MKITREQLIKMIKEELGDPAGEAEAERQRRARTAWKRRFTSVEEINAIADLMENDPEFEMLSRFADEFRRRSQRGTPPQDVLEVVLPESVPGGLIAKVILKARERLPADETPIKKPKSPALSGAEMDRIAPSLEETKTNKIKITKKQLKEIVEEEFLKIDEKKKKKKKKRKLTSKPSSETNLGDWFKRKGAKGKKGGWVDCNTCRKDKKTGRKTCKACGRSSGEKRAKYPKCRPTPSACSKKGNYGKKSKAGKKG